MKRLLISMMVTAVMLVPMAISPPPAAAYVPGKCYAHSSWVKSSTLFGFTAYYWRLHFSWCTSRAPYGTYGAGTVVRFSQYHSMDHVDPYYDDRGIVENKQHYFNYNGNPKSGLATHVKGHVVNCPFYLPCKHEYPYINVWMHSDGTYHGSAGL